MMSQLATIFDSSSRLWSQTLSWNSRKYYFFLGIWTIGLDVNSLDYLSLAGGDLSVASFCHWLLYFFLHSCLYRLVTSIPKDLSFSLHNLWTLTRYSICLLISFECFLTTFRDHTVCNNTGFVQQISKQSRQVLRFDSQAVDSSLQVSWRKCYKQTLMELF